MNNNAFLQTEILVKSSLDGTMQPSLFFAAKEKNRPLLVGLHTWSADRFNQIDNMLPFAKENDFNLLLPEFRGSNLESNSQADKACGSEFAKQDIKDAIDYVKNNAEKLMPVISHVRPLAEAQNTFDEIVSGKTNTMKVLLEINSGI